MEFLERRHDPHVFGVNRGAQVTGVACAALFCPWIAVMARCYVRLGIQKTFGKEDWVTLASLVPFPPSQVIYRDIDFNSLFSQPSAVSYSVPSSISA